jgi:phosphoribosylanthranilate isomerase
MHPPPWPHLSPPLGHAHLPFVKVCGITQLACAQAAVAAGASALGLIFVPNTPRFVGEDIPALAAITHWAKTVGVPLVGVFQNQSATEVNHWAHVAPLQAVQLHGEETPQQAAAIQQATGLPFIKVASLYAPPSAAGVQAFQQAGGVALLLDKPKSDPTPVAWGEEAPWQALLPPVIAQGPTWLGGNLNPGNVGAAYRRFKPWGLDVASGVEASPRQKCPALLHAFFEALQTKP